MNGFIFYLVLQVAGITTLFAQAPQHYSINIPGSSNLYVAQLQPNLCWAACNEILLQSLGVSEPQHTQVVKLFGEFVDKGAEANYDLAKGVLGGAYHMRSTDDYISVTPYVSYLSQNNPNDADITIQQLKRGIPVVITTGAHGRVCIGVDYVTAGGRAQITKFRLLNPAKSNQVEELTMQELLKEGLIGLMTVNVH